MVVDKVDNLVLTRLRAGGALFGSARGVEMPPPHRHRGRGGLPISIKNFSFFFKYAYSRTQNVFCKRLILREKKMDKMLPADIFIFK